MSSTVQQVPGITRTDLLRADLSVPGREVIQNRVQIGPEAPFVRHKHPGEEIIYVLEGSLEYHVDGNEPKTVNAGGSLVVPPRRFTRCGTSATATRRSSPPTSSRRASRSSWWSTEP